MEVHFFQKSFSDLAERIFLLTDKYSSDNKKKKKIPPRLTVIGDEKILSRIMLKDKRKNSHIHIMIIGN